MRRRVTRMSKRKRNRMPAVEVLWVDSCSPANEGWHKKADFADWAEATGTGCPIRSVGLLWASTKAGVTLVQGDSDGSVNAGFQIPWGCIRSVRYLTYKKARKKDGRTAKAR